MKHFVMFTDALTGKSILVRKSMIFSVEEVTLDQRSVRKIHFIDGRETEYVEDELIKIFNYLEEE